MAQQALGPDRVRTVALVGHRSAGRTTLAEHMLFLAGVVRAPGAVEEGTTLLDHDPVARRRVEGTLPGWAWMAWKDRMVFLTDTPGGDAFAWPARIAARGADLRVVVVSAPDGVEPGTERALREARADGAPVVVAVTRIDRVPRRRQVGWIEAIGQTVEAVLGRTAIQLGCPSAVEEDGWTHALADGAPPAAREALGEAIALTDDALLEAWVEAGRLEDAAARDGLARAVARCRTVPVLACSGRTGEGVRAVLDAITALAPAPSGQADAPLVVRRVGSTLADGDEVVSVFRVEQGTLRPGAKLVCPRTGAPVKVPRWYAIRGPRRAKAQTLVPGAVAAAWSDVPVRPGEALVGIDHPSRGEGASRVALPPRMAWRHLVPSDASADHALRQRIPTLLALDSSLTVDEEPGGWRLSGPSPDAVARAIWRLETRWGVRLTAGLPAIAYLERPARSVAGARGQLIEHVRVGQVDDVKRFGEVVVDVVPGDPDELLSLGFSCDEEALPARWHDAVAEGLRRAMLHGPSAGYPVCGIRAQCVDGAYDLFATEDADVAEASMLALTAALQESGTDLLEPWSELEIHAPPDTTGAVLHEVTACRGRVVGLEMDGDDTTVLAEVPDAELEAFAGKVRNASRALAWFARQRGPYRPVPDSHRSAVVEASPYAGGSGGGSGGPSGGGARPVSSLDLHPVSSEAGARASRAAR